MKLPVLSNPLIVQAFNAIQNKLSVPVRYPVLALKQAWHRINTAANMSGTVLSDFVSSFKDKAPSIHAADIRQ